jgi:hypothetical protein
MIIPRLLSCVRSLACTALCALGLHGAPAQTRSDAPPPVTAGALLLCIDRSGSMGAEAIGAMQQALRSTLVAADGQTELPFAVAIVAFGTRAEHLLSLTRDPVQVAQAVARLDLERGREGRTRLYDAVAGGLAKLRAADAGWKRLLVVSDGNDEGSSMPQATLIARAAAQPSIPVDAVGFGALAASASGSLATLAGATEGGRFEIAATRAELAAALGRMVSQSPQAAALDAALQMQGAAAPAAGEPAVVDEEAALPPASAAPLPLWAWGGAGALLLAVAVAAWLLRQGAAPVPAADASPVPLPARREAAPPRRDPAAAGRPSPRAAAPLPPARLTVVARRWPEPGEGRVVATLRHVDGASAAAFPVRLAETRIGSAADNDLVLGDDYASGHHVILKVEAGGLVLVDLGSRNGTTLNGVKFTAGTRSLSPGDRFTVGHTTLEACLPDAA